PEPGSAEGHVTFDGTQDLFDLTQVKQSRGNRLRDLFLLMSTVLSWRLAPELPAATRRAIRRWSWSMYPRYHRLHADLEAGSRAAVPSEGRIVLRLVPAWAAVL